VGVGPVWREVFLGGFGHWRRSSTSDLPPLLVRRSRLRGVGEYAGAAIVTGVIVLVLVYAKILPGVGPMRLVELSAAGREVDRGRALSATYGWSRGPSFALWAAALSGLPRRHPGGIVYIGLDKPQRTVGESHPLMRLACAATSMGVPL
jgi:hypothetical protein